MRDDVGMSKPAPPSSSASSALSCPAWPRLVEHQLTPYHATPVADWGPLLVLAPHPDDEVFGCGGVLALAAQAGVAMQVVVLTDGGAAGEAATREAESRAAARCLGGDALHDALRFWRLPDRGLQPDGTLVQRIAQALAQSQARWVIAPSPFEVHPDHRAVCLASVAALRTLPPGAVMPQLAFCEIGVPLLANTLVDTTAVAARKAAAMRCFASQLATQAYDAQIEALNRYRAYTLGPAVTHAEAFWVVPAEAMADGLGSLIASVAGQLRARA